MLALFLARAFSDASPISKLSIQILDGSKTVSEADLAPPERTSLALNENLTLQLVLATTFRAAPKHQVCVLESGVYSVSSPFSFKERKLSLALHPSKLRKLYKHAAVYNLRIAISDSALSEPFLWEVGTINYETWGEVFDNFSDVEWDFQPDPKTPNALLTFVFTLVMFVPFGVFLLLLLLNGVNCGYFPRSPFDAIVSLAFVIGLGGFFGFFVYFWKFVTFEEMCKDLLVIVPVLGLLLRGALVGRAKMEASHSDQKQVKVD
jgi:hypothetical protein